mmetsp:Transcript_11562/g.36340  ORF Transcript_11562/g.36340 Transcript_11562/m.36340 type:complete len:366 (-) Transcript_11562:409-1506(-)
MVAAAQTLNLSLECLQHRLQLLAVAAQAGAASKPGLSQVDLCQEASGGVQELLTVRVGRRALVGEVLDAPHQVLTLLHDDLAHEVLLAAQVHRPLPQPGDLPLQLTYPALQLPIQLLETAEAPRRSLGGLPQDAQFPQGVGQVCPAGERLGERRAEVPGLALGGTQGLPEVARLSLTLLNRGRGHAAVEAHRRARGPRRRGASALRSACRRGARAAAELQLQRRGARSGSLLGRAGRGQPHSGCRLHRSSILRPVRALPSAGSAAGPAAAPGLAQARRELGLLGCDGGEALRKFEAPPADDLRSSPIKQPPALLGELSSATLELFHRHTRLRAHPPSLGHRAALIVNSPLPLGQLCQLDGTGCRC